MSAVDPWPADLTCGRGGERQTQHLRVVGLDLHQLVQEIQTEDTEDKQRHVSWTSPRPAAAVGVASLTAGSHSGLRLPGAARQD